MVSVETVAMALCCQALQRAVHFPPPDFKLAPTTTFRAECWTLKTMSAIDRRCSRGTVAFEASPPGQTEPHGLVGESERADGLSVFASYHRMTGAVGARDATLLRLNLRHCIEFALGSFARFAECAMGRALRTGDDAGLVSRFTAALSLAWGGATLPQQQSLFERASAAWKSLLPDPTASDVSGGPPVNSVEVVRPSPVEALGNALAAAMPDEAEKAALVSTQPPLLPQPLHESAATGTSPVRRARGPPAPRDASAQHAVNAPDTVPGAEGMKRTPGGAIHVHGSIASSRLAVVRTSFGAVEASALASDGAVMHARQSQCPDALAMAHLGKAVSAIEAGNLRSAAEDLSIALHTCHKHRHLAAPPATREASGLVRAEAAALVAAASTLLLYGGAPAEGLLAKISTGVAKGSAFYLAARHGTPLHQRQAVGQAPGDPSGGSGQSAMREDTAQPITGSEVGRSPALRQVVSSALTAARVAASSLGTQADRDLILFATAHVEAHARRLALTPDTTAVGLEALRMHWRGSVACPTPWASANLSLAVSWALTACHVDLDGVSRGLDALDEARQRCGDSATHDECHRALVARSVIAAQGLLDQGFAAHAASAARRARLACALPHGVVCGSTERQLAVSATRVLGEALTLLGDTARIPSECIDWLDSCVLRPAAASAASSSQRKAAPAMEDPLLAPANDLLDPVAHADAEPGSASRPESGDVEAAWLRQMLAARVVAASGRYAEAGRLMTSLAERTRSIGLDGLSAVSGVQGLVLACKGRQAPAATLQVPIARVPPRVAADLLAACAMMHVSHARHERENAPHPVPAVPIADVGAGCARAIHAFRCALVGRLSTGGAAGTTSLHVPLATQLLLLSQGMRAPGETDGCVDTISGGATLRDVVATFVDAAASERSQVRLQELARTLAQRRSGAVEPPASLALQ